MANAVIETNEQATPVERALSGPQRLVEYLKETRAEMHKVSVPTRDQVQTTTLVVIVTVFLFAAYFELVDVVIGNGIDSMFKWLIKH
jgi:preprotein translocase subunit SecE